MPVLTAIDLIGIQRYIFASNRVRDVVSGSWLVHWSTSKKDRNALDSLVDPETALFSGGGNAVLEFEDIEAAKAFAMKYSRLLIDEAPGLEAAIVHRKYNDGELARALLAIQIDLARKKTDRLPSAPMAGLSVTAACRETRLPAVGVDPHDPEDRNKPLSATILKRRARLEEANDHWRDFLGNHSKDYEFPLKLQDVGRTPGAKSLIGVVHIDGNGVGLKIKQWLTDRIAGGAPDDVVRGEYRKWSGAIDTLGRDAFQSVVNKVRGAVETTHDPDGQKTFKLASQLKSMGFGLKTQRNGKCSLPLRPILLGGDDLTFVCDGRIAFSLAETALSVFDAADIPILGKLPACAGVAICRVQSPFARAYDLSERLCRSAKTMLTDEGISGCALDWHIGASRPGQTDADIRHRQFRTNAEESLTCRPYGLGDAFDEVKNWRWLTRTFLDNPKDGLRRGYWKDSRNKVKSLREVVRQGAGSVQQTLKAWQAVNPKFQLPEPVREDGFFESRTPILDALELMDLHAPLAAKGQEPMEAIK